MWQWRPKATYSRQTYCLQPDNAEQRLPVANTWCHAVTIGGTLGAKQTRVLHQSASLYGNAPNFVPHGWAFQEHLKNRDIAQAKQKQQNKPKEKAGYDSSLPGK